MLGESVRHISLLLIAAANGAAARRLEAIVIGATERKLANGPPHELPVSAHILEVVFIVVLLGLLVIVKRSTRNTGHFSGEKVVLGCDHLRVNVITPSLVDKTLGI